MTKQQKKQYQEYINKRDLGMPISDYKVIINLYNEVFKQNINFDEFIKSNGVTHKISKIERKLDKKLVSTLLTN